MIDWESVSEEDTETLLEIADRCEDLFYVEDKTNLLMDLTAAHLDVPLKLSELLEADELNFTHDVLGIGEHINRETGELENSFCPRYAVS